MVVPRIRRRDGATVSKPHTFIGGHVAPVSRFLPIGHRTRGDLIRIGTGSPSLSISRDDDGDWNFVS